MRPVEPVSGPGTPSEGSQSRVPPLLDEIRGSGWWDEQDSGPPTREDDWWFTVYVAARGYPPPKRDPEPMPGQTKLVWPDGPVTTPNT